MKNRVTRKMIATCLAALVLFLPFSAVAKSLLFETESNIFSFDQKEKNGPIDLSDSEKEKGAAEKELGSEEDGKNLSEGIVLHSWMISKQNLSCHPGIEPWDLAPDVIHPPPKC